ncbi:MAG: endo-1,4-beta-xylanase [Planctomycetota bacterium]
MSRPTSGWIDQLIYSLLAGLTLLLVLAFGAPASVQAESTPPDVPPGGEAVILPDAAFQLFNYGPPGQIATHEHADAEGGGDLHRVAVERPGDRHWHAEFKTRDLAPVRTGDVMLLRLRARATRVNHETGTAAFLAYFQHPGPPFDPSLKHMFEVGQEWSELLVPFRAIRNHRTGESELAFGLALREQTVELADIELVNFRDAVRVRDLPVTSPDYDGRSADAPWRAEAAARIRTHRTSPVSVRVLDASGVPVVDARVAVTMEQSAFQLGTAVQVDLLLDQTEDAHRYRRALTSGRFSFVAIANALKWGAWVKPATRERAERAIEWLASRGFDIRGHTLVWPSWRKTRVEHVRALEGNPSALAAAIDDRVRDGAAALRGRIAEWDAINEPCRNNDFMALLGDEAMIRWLDLARETDPDVGLILNETHILPGGGTSETPQQAELKRILTLLQDAGAPLDGLGLQGHFATGGLTPPARLVEILDDFAQFNLPIRITELDVVTSDETLQAEYTRDVLTALYSHPAVEMVTLWHFWDGFHWRHNTLMYRLDWSLKPSGEVIERLLLSEWRTDERGTTGERGVYATRAHHGVHTIRVEHDGRTAEQRVEIMPGPFEAEVVLR